MDVWLYYRISSDPRDQRAGVSRQRQDCTAEADRRGWTIAGEVEDNDRTAFEGAPRPGYLRLIGGIEAGTVRAVIADRGDRLHRDLAEALDYERLARRHKVTTVFVKGGEWDVETASGRLTGHLLTAIAEHESALKREKINRALLQRAEAGLPANTRFRPFGFEADGLTPRALEARLIRQGADMLLRGESLGSVARLWNKTTTGARNILLKPRLIGYREHQGQMYPLTGATPILDRETWEAVRAVILAKQTGRAQARSYLLSGLARCGSCNGPLRSRKVRRVRYYNCASTTCPGPKVARAADRLEQFVADELILGLVVEGRQAPAVEDHLPTLAELAKLDGRIRQVESAMADPDADDFDTLRRVHGQLTARVSALRDTLAAAPVRAVGPSLPLPDGLDAGPWAAWWDAAGFDDRRALLLQHVAEVVVLPTRHGRLPLAADSVDVRWHSA